MKKYRNPNIPNKVFRRLRAGETIKYGDFCNSNKNPLYMGWTMIDKKMEILYKENNIKVDNLFVFLYREIPHLSNLPE